MMNGGLVSVGGALSGLEIPIDCAPEGAFEIPLAGDNRGKEQEQEVERGRALLGDLSPDPLGIDDWDFRARAPQLREVA